MVGDCMFILFAFLAALFAGITAIFAKIGISELDVNIATAIRTTIILVFNFIIFLCVGDFNDIKEINTSTLIFIISSGITTSLLWLSYFKALQLGDVNKVAPIDKTSTVLTLILSAIFLGEKITSIKIISIVLILLGTIMMIVKNNEKSNNKWIIYAVLTAIFTSLATILGKIGIKDIEFTLGITIRTLVVFIIIWTVVILNRKIYQIKKIRKKCWLFLSLSGITTGISWFFYFKALQTGEASIVFPIEKLSIVVTIIFSSIILKEKLNLKSIIGLIILVVGTVILLI